MGESIRVRGMTIDLDRVFAKMWSEAHTAADGRLVHARGLKYLLGEMYGLPADAGVPAQPLFDMRRETASALQQLGWVKPVKRNSGRYELLRGAAAAPKQAKSSPAATRRLQHRPVRREAPPQAQPVHRGHLSDFFQSLATRHQLHLLEGMTASAMAWAGLYSTERQPIYRYAFAQWWSATSTADLLAWVLLNPGVGDTQGTPRSVLGRCRNLTRRFGFGGLVIVNLFAFRAREPDAVPAGSAAIGPANDSIIETITGATGRTVAAWGNGGRRGQRAEHVRALLEQPLCVTKNGNCLTEKGEPFYPKAIPATTELVPLP